MSTGLGVRELYSRLALAPDSYVILTQSFNLSGPVSSVGKPVDWSRPIFRSFPAGKFQIRFHDSVKNGF